MKKSVVIIILVVLLLLMSSAYALWTDTVSVSVTTSNAIISTGYTSRTSNPQKLQYTVQASGALSSTNPYTRIEETVMDMTYKQNVSSTHSVTYTITNIGEVAATLDGVSVLSKSVDYSSPVYTDTIRIDYTVSNTNTIPAYNSTVTVTDFDAHTGVSFPNSSTNILNVGESCTLTVNYYRVTSGDKNIDKTKITIIKTDQLSCSVS